MLNSLELINFLSFEREVIDLRGSRSIAIVGENGAGKSSLLEGLAYAYFGIGRAHYPTDLARLNGDGSFYVGLHLSDIPEMGDELLIERGFDKEKGFARVVMLNDENEEEEVVAQGKGVNPYIEEITGLSPEMFMLTAFFGLGDNDKADPLLKVQPARCLETLQKIANVYIYTKFHDAAKGRAKFLEKDLVTLDSRIETQEENVGDMKSLENDLSRLEVKEFRTGERLAKSRKERTELSADEEKYRAIVKERDVLQEGREHLRESLDKHRRKIKALQEGIEVTKGSLDEAIERRDFEQNELKLGDLVELEKQIEKSNIESSNKETFLELKAAASVMDKIKRCPLCDGVLTKETIAGWKMDVRSLEKELKALLNDRTEKRAISKTLRGYEKSLSALIENVKGYISELEDDKNGLDLEKREYKSVKSELEKKNARYATLCKTLGEEYDGVVASLEEVNEDIESLQRESGELKQAILDLREDIAENKTRINQIKSDQKIAARKKKMLKAMSLVLDAFSRFGIPLDLLKTLNKSIENIATDVYKEFDNGSIEIEEIKGGKPGLRFVLNDRKGRRPFSMLSQGERVMFFVAVRVAVAQIIAKARKVNIDFLVLDEGMANLSEKNRDNMVRLINKILKQLFPQVIMVSHTEMRDIFSSTIKVEVENDVSRALVS